MNITIDKEQKVLPQLIKQSTTYKLIVPAKVEEKIRYLQRKYPSTEWSGVLFFTHSGNFEDNNLVITCEDIYPMDLGNATYTEYKMDETVASYMAENIELFDCDMGLVHSHHVMSTTFSGTDTNTLKEEGNERNCFVSLIVNNAGTYSAAVTRKRQTKKKVTTEFLGDSYQFFGQGSVYINGSKDCEISEQVDTTTIEYFMLDVEVEKVDNPLDYLDERFKEIEAKKKPSVIIPYTRTTPLTSKDAEGVGYAVSTYSPADKDEDFYSWIHSKDKKETQEGILFDDKTMDDLKIVVDWTPSPVLVHKAVVQIVACSFIIDPAKFDLKQWIVRHMARKYDEIFKEITAFDNWAEFVIEFVLMNFFDEGAPEEAYEDLDSFQSTVAEAIYEELSEYADYSKYITNYLEILQRYI